MSEQELYEEHNYIDFIDNHLNFQSQQIIFEKKELHKIKFQLLTKLVSNLYLYKNSREHYTTISNLIVLTLAAFDLDSFLDIPTELKLRRSKLHPKTYKKMLMKEYQNYSLLD